MGFVVIAAILCGSVYLAVRRARERAGNAPLRNAIEARVSFRTRLDRASILGTGGFRGTRGVWVPLRGPKRLVVGTDAFMVCAPQALREIVFIGYESSIALSQAPSRVANRDWIIITTGQAGGRQIRLAITRDNLQEIWQALAGTGATLVPAAGELEQPGMFAYGLGRVTGWRRVAVSLVFVALLIFGPALVLFVARHLP
jgi:hypothetical protein